MIWGIALFSVLVFLGYKRECRINEAERKAAAERAAAEAARLAAPKRPTGRPRKTTTPRP